MSRRRPTVNRKALALFDEFLCAAFAVLLVLDVVTIGYLALEALRP